MFESGLTLQERQLRLLLQWWVGVFFGAAIVFGAAAEQVIYWLNSIGHVLFNWPGNTLQLPAEHFWQVLAVALLVVLTYAAFVAQRDVRQNLSFVKIIIVSKLASVIGFVLAFVLDGPYFAYLAGAVIDFIILAMTWFCYSRTLTSRAL